MKIQIKKLNNKLCYYRRDESNEDVTFYLDDLLRIEKQVEEVKVGEETLFKANYNHKLMSDQYYVYLPISLINYLKGKCEEIGYELDLSELDLVPIGINVETKVDFLSKIYGENSDKIIDLLSSISNYKNP